MVAYTQDEKLQRTLQEAADSVNAFAAANPTLPGSEIAALSAATFGTVLGNHASRGYDHKPLMR